MNFLNTSASLLHMVAKKLDDGKISESQPAEATKAAEPIPILLALEDKPHPEAAVVARQPETMPAVKMEEESDGSAMRVATELLKLQGKEAQPRKRPAAAEIALRQKPATTDRQIVERPVVLLTSDPPCGVSSPKQQPLRC